MTTERPPIIAIDGPAGAGKSTIAKRLAEALGFILLDTGALYRTVALAASRAGLTYRDADRVAALARELVDASALGVEREAGRGMRMRLRGEDVSDAIRTPEIALGASTVSSYPAVRDALLDLQRLAGSPGGVVLEGRDIGTVVFPDAEVKFFLTASLEVRAKRRHAELLAKGTTLSLEETLDEVRRRDEQDTQRPVAPLRQAADAVLIDSSDMSIDEVVARMVRIVDERTKARG